MINSYADFRSTYAWTLKNYPGTSNLYQDDFYGALIGHCTKARYEKAGSRWKKVSEEREDVTPAYYFNTVDAIPWFRQHSGKELVHCGYCTLGYVPLEIHSLSPDRQVKCVFTFKLL